METHPVLREAARLTAQAHNAQAEDLLRAHIDDSACAVRLREMLLGERRNDEAAELARRLLTAAAPECEVSRAVLQFLEGDLQGSLRSCQQVLAGGTASATAWNHAGRALHNLGQPQQALSAFERATTIDPTYPEALNNLGHAQRAVGDLGSAVTSFGKALALSGGYRVARHNLAATHFHLDHIDSARAEYDTLLAGDPRDAEALLGRGLCHQLHGRLQKAAADFDQALALQPDNAVAHLYRGILCNELMDTEAALRYLEAAVRLDPRDVEAWTELAGVNEQANRLDDAQAAVTRGLAVGAGYPPLILESARLARRRGAIDSAVRQLRSVDPQQLPPRAALQYFHELGMSLDRAGAPVEAIHAFTEANRLASATPRARAADRQAFSRRCAALDDWLADGAPGMKAAQDDPPEDPGADLVFLVGFPRSGTTLVDTTLATADNVCALEEPPTLDVVVADLQQQGGGYPGSLNHVSARDVTRLRHAYREAFARAWGGAPHGLLIDKMPLRFLHAGLIQRLFPASRLLFMLRHPCDVVLSNFMQLYAVNETNIHFDTLLQCTQMYDRIMQQWYRLEALLELPLHYVRYEAMVADARRTIDGVCDFLGLPHDAVKLDERRRIETRDRIRTASYQQVGEPIYARASGRWQAYREHLEPFFERLQPHVERLGYSLRADTDDPPKG